MHLKMLLGTVKKWWRPENGTVSMLDLIWAKAQVKLLTGLISTSSLVDMVMSKIRRGVYETLSRAKATIVRRAIEREAIDFPNYTVGTNITTLPQWSFAPLQAGSGLYTIGNTVPNNTITFGNPSNPNVLVITADGDVEWNGKPSEAAEALKRTFQFVVEDMKGVTKAARRRYYLRACQNILNKAKTMEQDQFLAFLQKQVYNKERRVIMDSLKEE